MLVRDNADSVAEVPSEITLRVDRDVPDVLDNLGRESAVSCVGESGVGVRPLVIVPVHPLILVEIARVAISLPVVFDTA